MWTTERLLRRALLLLLAWPLLALHATGQTAILCDCDDPQEAPCGNGLPTALWGGCINSLGTKPRLDWMQGTTNVVTDDLVLAAYPIPPQAPGLLFMGPERVRLPLGDGLLCVGGGKLGIFRFPVQQADANGLVLLGPGLVAEAAALFGPAGQIQAGDTWNVQYWYRDAGGPCGTGFNLTNGLALTFD